jgi:hypothetical protein
MDRFSSYYFFWENIFFAQFFLLIYFFTMQERISLSQLETSMFDFHHFHFLRFDSFFSPLF